MNPNRRVQLAKASSRLTQSKTFQRWLDAPVFELSDVKYSRRDIAALTDTPCISAAGILHRTCQQYRIHTVKHLYYAGLDGLLRCRGVGERTAWIAACVLYTEGYSVRQWARLASKTMESAHVRSVRGAIRLVHDRTQKQKHG